MTREEQIRQASIEYTIKDRPMCIGGGAFSEIVDEMNRNYAFEEGAKWADEHPNLSEEELVGMGDLGIMWQKKALIKKACELLKKMIWEVTYEDLEGNSIQHHDKIEFIEDFKKAMEE